MQKLYSILTKNIFISNFLKLNKILLNIISKLYNIIKVKEYFNKKFDKYKIELNKFRVLI